MSEQAPGADLQPDTHAVGGPQGAAAEEVDWQARAIAAEDRYGNLQPEYTRASQEAAQLREAIEWHELLVTSEDPDIRRQAAEVLGYEFEEEPEPDPGQFQDPLEPVNQRLEYLESLNEQAQEDQNEAEYASAVRGVLDERLAQLMPDAGEVAQNMVLAYAINALPVADDGLPDLNAAHEVWSQLQDDQQKSWVDSKRAANFSPNGLTGTEVPNLDNDQERQDYMVRRLQSNLEP
jgi:hypothetical protein